MKRNKMHCCATYFGLLVVCLVCVIGPSRLVSSSNGDDEDEASAVFANQTQMPTAINQLAPVTQVTQPAADDEQQDDGNTGSSSIELLGSSSTTAASGAVSINPVVRTSDEIITSDQSDGQNHAGGNRTCPMGWTFVEGSCYKVHVESSSHKPMLFTWRDARNYCRSYDFPQGTTGSDLATFDRPDVIWMIFHNISPTRDPAVVKRIGEVWIGLTASPSVSTATNFSDGGGGDITTKVWTWVDGKTANERPVPWRSSVVPTLDGKRRKIRHESSSQILTGGHHRHHDKDATIEVKSKPDTGTKDYNNHHHHHHRRHGNRLKPRKRGQGRPQDKSITPAHRPDGDLENNLEEEDHLAKNSSITKRIFKRQSTNLPVGKYSNCGAVGPEFSDLFTFSVTAAPCEALKGFVCQVDAVRIKESLAEIEVTASVLNKAPEAAMTTTEVPAASTSACCGVAQGENPSGKWFFHRGKRCCYGFFGFLADADADGLNSFDAFIEDNKGGVFGSDEEGLTAAQDALAAWDDAVKRCQVAGGHLVSIEDHQEAAFILQQAQRLASSTYIERYYIGLRRNYHDSFVWTNGNQSDYFAWNEGEPNYFGNQESCVTMDVANGYWNDENCGIRYPFVCKTCCDFTESQKSPIRKKTHGEVTLLASSSRTHQMFDKQKEDSVEQTCPEGWRKYQKACFKVFLPVSASSLAKPAAAAGDVVSQSANWESARDECRNLGKTVDLASIHSQKENGFVHALLHEAVHVQSSRDDPENKVNPVEAAWIGLSSKFFAGESFYWADESPIDFSDWDHPEPSREDRHKRIYQEDCVALRLHGGQGFWNTMSCNESLPFICRSPLLSEMVAEKQELIHEDEAQEREFAGKNSSDGHQHDHLRCQGNLSEFLQFKGRCYRHFTSHNYSRAFHKAESYCRHHHGGHLVSLNSPSEYHFILTHLLLPPASDGPTNNHTITADTASNEGNVWLGIKYDHSSQLLRWMDSWPLGFQKWDSNFSPEAFMKNQTRIRNSHLHSHVHNNSNLTKGPLRPKHCFAMSMQSGLWSSIDDCSSARLGFVCEVDPLEPVPKTARKEKGIGGRCPIRGWLDMPESSHCFWVEKIDTQTCKEARQKCIAFGGDLASIHGHLEQRLIYAQLQDNIDVWIGLHKTHNGSLIWLDGTEVDFQRWALNEPNSDDEMCVEMYGSTGRWNDNDCSKFKGYVCQVAKVLPQQN